MMRPGTPQQPDGCSFTLLACSFNYNPPKSPSHDKNLEGIQSRISLSKKLSESSNTDSRSTSKQFTSFSVVGAPYVAPSTNNQGVQTEVSPSRSSRIRESKKISFIQDNQSRQQVSDFPILQPQHIFNERKGTFNGGLMNEAGDITLFDGGRQKRNTHDYQIHANKENFAARRTHTEGYEDTNPCYTSQQCRFTSQSHRNQRNSSNYASSSVKTFQNSILKNSQFSQQQQYPSRISQLKERPHFNLGQVKTSHISGFPLTETLASSKFYKQSAIVDESRRFQRPSVGLSINQHPMISEQELNGYHSRKPSSPRFQKRIKTLVDLDCKSVHSSGQGDRTSSYHVSIAASYNSSSPSVLTGNNSLFRQIKQMTVKNLPVPPMGSIKEF